jgi:predicted RNase H-like HicB family nuclease
METYIQTDGKWVATIWIVREFYIAEGKTKEEAIQALKYHLENIIPIYENDIQVAQERIKGIKQWVSSQELVGH